MLFPSKKDPLVGLDIGNYAIKMVQLDQTKKGIELKAFGMINLEPEAIVEDNIEKPEEVVEAVKKLLRTEQIKTKNAAVALPGRSVVIKKISLPAASEYSISQLLNIEAEQYIPFEVTEASLDYHVISKGNPEIEGSQQEVLLVATQAGKVNDYKNILSQAGLNPVIVDVDVFALENGFEVNYGTKHDEIIALIDIGSGVTSINILEDGITTFTRDVNYAGDMITFSIRDELDVSQEMAEQLKRGVEMAGISPLRVKEVLSSAIEELCGQLSNTFDLFKETSDREVGKIWLTGGTAKIKDIDRFMTESLGTPAEVANPFNNIRVDEKSFDLEYIKYWAPTAAVSVGLATRKFGDKEEDTASSEEEQA